ncbi:hypothetical protein [Falsiroseomonas sp.]|uniref:hypothetical protein n=1 Tax=Falsiroseomonas sp. TaxID=2870721 RepID=UPI0027345EBD|nr:hypothetical protein [Falsiroseomonas sp.]
MRSVLTRRGALVASLAAMMVAAPGAAMIDPDAGLVALCTEHAASLERFNALGGKDDFDECPLAARYFAACDALDEASPTTMSGVLALAGAALREASAAGDPNTGWDGFAAQWAGQAVMALLHVVQPEVALIGRAKPTSAA